MYAHCHICRAELGANTVIPHMPVGRKLAYDAGKGRLWVVCPACAEWNLTPLEERWEAIEECEAIVASSPVRASTANIGLSRSDGLELIRSGPALRDELANWRYGPRFDRRRRRARIMGAAAGGVFVTGVGAAALMGMLAAGPAMALWAAAFGVVWLSGVGKSVSKQVGPDREVRIVDTSGRRIRFTGVELGHVFLIRSQNPRKPVTLSVSVPSRDEPVILRREDALVALGTVLPRLNWDGASAHNVRAATSLVDQAEERVRDGPASARSAATVWEWLAVNNWPTDGTVAALHAIPLLALEMAVSEELERLAMVGEASVLGTRWMEAETVAAISDDMFVPDSIREWIRERSGKTPS